MHYDARAFSKNDFSKTVTPTDSAYEADSGRGTGHRKKTGERLRTTPCFVFSISFVDDVTFLQSIYGDVLLLLYFFICLNLLHLEPSVWPPPLRAFCLDA